MSSVDDTERPAAALPRAVCVSRASALAMTQARSIAAQLAMRGVASTILNVTTAGDRIQDRPLSEIGGTAVFVKEIEQALREGKGDYAVHSCKDLATQIPDDMQIVAISVREDARDAFCSERYATFGSLPAGAVVGTSSLRRRAFLTALRPDLRYADLRGNVDTRLRKLRDGDYDAVVLAMAGLLRLKLRATHTVPFPVGEFVPAAAQGALAVETRCDEPLLATELRAAVNDEAAELCITCERSALGELEGGCRAPIGIYAAYEDGTACARGAVATLDGTRIVRASVEGAVRTHGDARRLGLDLAHELRARGASAILDGIAKAGAR
ncbi:MAG: hydroxymethylbilane synthase [Vulcanimicrobiaceae bacterium]